MANDAPIKMNFFISGKTDARRRCVIQHHSLQWFVDATQLGRESYALLADDGRGLRLSSRLLGREVVPQLFSVKP